MRNKKGAIELSMTTIIVIVIGVALLSFGLFFVNKIRIGVLDLSDATFEDAQKQLSEGLSDVTKFLTISPDSVSIQPDGDRSVKVVVLNLEERDVKVKLVTTPIKDDKLRCLFYDTKESESLEYPLTSGAKTPVIPLLVQDLNGGIRATGCRVVVSGGQTSESQGTLLVRVDK
ncbi:MAG TPA: hypothetical protein HA226_05095 [Nanoarchaeota archaeon]|nr:MAG: hypothetical protein QT09_C0002G0011 [archaeon GW2011_AR18]HIH26117.1 hypothetical protein [Nanoarchaeota archaeon]